MFELGNRIELTPSSTRSTRWRARNRGLRWSTQTQSLLNSNSRMESCGQVSDWQNWESADEILSFRRTVRTAKQRAQ